MAANTISAALDFPASLPHDAEVNVPFPANSHPRWTVEPFAGVGLPATFDNLLNLPDPSKEPAFHAAAVDCVRMTNWVFELTGTYAPLAPLTEEHIMELLDRWPSTVTAQGKRVKLAPEEDFPLPPDGRMLFVKEKLEDPTDYGKPVVWVAACRSWARMSDAQWEAYLGLSRDQLIAQAKARLGGDDSWLVQEIFKRYLVWDELAQGVSERAKAFADRQPSAEELEEFFEREDVKTNGATLVDICHAFPHARDPKMLVYRIEHFATLTDQPSVLTRLGLEDPVESRYVRKPDPTKRDIKIALSALLYEPGNSVDLLELGEEYCLTSANRQLILDVLTRRTVRDVTSGRYIKPGNDPQAHEIRMMMTPFDFTNGFTLSELARRFPYRVSSLTTLLMNIAEFIYEDQDEQLYFPSFLGPEGHPLPVDESFVQRTQMRIRMFDADGPWDPATIEDDFNWDRAAMTYVARPDEDKDEEGLNDQDLADELISLPSTTGLTDDESPAPKVVNSIQLNVTSVETVPVEPSVPGNVMLSSVAVAAESVPVEPLAPAPIAFTPTPAAPASALIPLATTSAPAPAIADNSIRGEGRPSKRAATEPADESSRNTKKARKTLRKIRCAGTTQKGSRCKRNKDGEDGDEDWRCASHRE